MVSYEIRDTGPFMKKLLTERTFDGFSLVEGDIVTFVSFHIDGRIEPSFYSEEEQEEIKGISFAPWVNMRPLVYNVIRGKRLPASFRLVLQLSDKNTRWLLEKNELADLGDKLQGLYVNIRWQKRRLTCITGLSFKTFVMDKSLEKIWDRFFLRFLTSAGIDASPAQPA